jgi:nucleotide-binding universal stress UspA family protein
MLAAATEQVRYNVADPEGWQIQAASGPAAPTIADMAHEECASLIVMGLGKHDLADRMFGSETAVRVMQQARTPVLAVPQNWIGIPRRALVAVDFSPASLRAAQTAMRILAPGGSVCFAHVAPALGHPDHADQLVEIYQARLNEELDAFIAAVGVPDDVTVTRAPLYGDTPHALLEFARKENVDLIVAGTRGRNALTRFVLGSVATSIVRGAQCAVLVASEVKGANG